MTDDELKELVRDYIIDIIDGEAGDSLHEIEAIQDLDEDDFENVYARLNDLYGSASVLVYWYEEGPITGVFYD